MKKTPVVRSALLILALTLTLAPIAQAAPPSPRSSQVVDKPRDDQEAPPLPPNTVAEPMECVTQDDVELCSVLFHTPYAQPATTSNKGAGMREILANLYACGKDFYHNGAFGLIYDGRIQQNVYGNYPVFGGVGWRLDSGNLSVTNGSFTWWLSLNGPNPDAPWGTNQVAVHVDSSAWLNPPIYGGLKWVNTYHQPGGAWSCSVGP